MSPTNPSRRNRAPENRSRGLTLIRLTENRTIARYAEDWYSALTLHAILKTTQTKQRIKKTEETLLRAISSVRNRRRAKTLL